MDRAPAFYYSIWKKAGSRGIEAHRARYIDKQSFNILLDIRQLSDISGIYDSTSQLNLLKKFNDL
jgi:hypothetical protein